MMYHKPINDRLNDALAFSIKRKLSKVSCGVVYIIGCHDFVKVGLTTKSPNDRLSQLQTGCPYELKLLKAFDSKDVELDEKKLHNLWKRYEIRGEWFSVPAGELAFVLSAKAIPEI